MRLMNIEQIKAEKLCRGATWLKERLKPKVRGVGRGGSLYDERDVDALVERCVAEEQRAEEERLEQQRADEKRRQARPRAAVAA